MTEWQGEWGSYPIPDKFNALTTDINGNTRPLFAEFQAWVRETERATKLALSVGALQASAPSYPYASHRNYAAEGSND